MYKPRGVRAVVFPGKRKVGGWTAGLRKEDELTCEGLAGARPCGVSWPVFRVRGLT